MFTKIKAKIIHKLGGATRKEYDDLYKSYLIFHRERDYYLDYILNKPGLDLSDMKLSPHVSLPPDCISADYRVNGFTD